MGLGFLERVRCLLRRVGGLACGGEVDVGSLFEEVRRFRLRALESMRRAGREEEVMVLDEYIAVLEEVEAALLQVEYLLAGGRVGG